MKTTLRRTAVAPHPDPLPTSGEGEGPSRRFEWTFIAVTTWLLSGAYLDAWAHRHFAFESFFTPWHAVLYSGMAAVLIFLALNTLRNQARGVALARALPEGYGLSLVGCIAFAISGSIDMLWHLRFGIERSLAALISPPHLFLMASLALIATGPLRAAWRRPITRAPWTAIISASMLLSMFTFFNQFDEPLVNPWPGFHATPDILPYIQQLGILGIMVQSALLTGMVLYLLHRFQLPFGSIALLAGLNGILLGALEEQFTLIPVAIAGGLLADLVLAWLRPGPDRVGAMRLATFLGPVAVSALYLLVVSLTIGMTWPITLWLGSVVVSGAIGLLLSYLVFPPASPSLQLRGD